MIRLSFTLQLLIITTMENINTVEKEIIATIIKLVEYLQINGSSSLSNISSNMLVNSSKFPIWKRSGMTIADFIRKFPQIFSWEKDTSKVTLVSDIINETEIIRLWNVVKTDFENMEEKTNQKLVVFELPNNLEFIITSDINECNNWITSQIETYNCEYFGFDRETTIGSKTGKPSTIQLSTPYSNMLLQLTSLDKLPSKLVEFLEDPKILKIGVAIDFDMQEILKFFDEPKIIKGVLDLSDLAKTLGIYSTNGLNCSHSIKELAALLLSVYIDNKDTMDVKNLDWDTPTLLMEQINYAITDSWIAMKIYETILLKYVKNDIVNIVKSKIFMVKKPIVNTKKKIDKSELHKKEQEKKLAEIERKIKKWANDEDELNELVFKPMNSFYRSHIHVTCKKYPGIKSESRGEDPSKYVVLSKI
ncbi:exonuclease [Tupanvirus soda lake]|uniref:Exonuclease n=2 Tax=Tupanvirus TaxID=2094720 RepID=A0A6N1NS63_9VIRU|nr:exonuclease [Tupanvirus soda lake]QKU35347.1 exonuclease [Tupanvirus soda lake]